MDELLARDSLGGPQYDDILEKVLARTEALEPQRAASKRHRSPRRWTLAFGALAASATAAWLVVPAMHGGAGHFATKGGDTKGGNAQPSGVFEIGCGPSARPTCRVGDTLMVSVNAAVAWGQVGAYAERADDPEHSRIWYFPSPAGGVPLVAHGAGTVVLPEGIKVGPEHQPGSYRVTLWLSSRPVDRDPVDFGDADIVRSHATLMLEILR